MRHEIEIYDTSTPTPSNARGSHGREKKKAKGKAANQSLVTTRDLKSPCQVEVGKSRQTVSTDLPRIKLPDSLAGFLPGSSGMVNVKDSAEYPSPESPLVQPGWELGEWVGPLVSVGPRNSMTRQRTLVTG